MDLRRFFTSQAWWGKVLCAFLGFLVAGPVGAFFGVFIGNLFDRGLNEHFSNPLWRFHAEKNPDIKNIFFEATFSILGHISKSDGRVSELEIQMAKSLMHDMHLYKREQQSAQYYFNEGKKDGFNLNHMLDRLQKAAHNNPQLLQLFIDIQYRAAQLDGLSDKKFQIMNTILASLQRAPMHEQARFNEDFYYRSSNRHRSAEPSPVNTLAEACAILQVKPDSSKQDVKRAYRRLISKNHPDKLMAHGKSQEQIKQANEKTQTIRKAYEQICASKGW